MPCLTNINLINNDLQLFPCSSKFWENLFNSVFLGNLLLTVNYCKYRLNGHSFVLLNKIESKNTQEFQYHAVASWKHKYYHLTRNIFRFWCAAFLYRVSRGGRKFQVNNSNNPFNKSLD